MHTTIGSKNVCEAHTPQTNSRAESTRSCAPGRRARLLQLDRVDLLSKSKGGLERVVRS